jgi:hypothetical protein
MCASPLTVTLALPLRFEQESRTILEAAGVSAQDAGPARGAVEAAALLVAVVPSIATLAVVLEKLRRLKLPRTYVVIGRDGCIDLYTDDETPDGRILVIHGDGTVNALPDSEITPGLLKAAMTGSQVAHEVEQ